MENQQNDIIELRFSGNGINPYQVKPSEIADLIKSFEQALTLTIKSTHPEVNTDIILFTFDSIHDESLDIRFKPKDILRDVVLSSYVLISSSFTTGEYYKIPDAAIPALKAITKFSKSE